MSVCYPKLLSLRCVILDIETTGLDPRLSATIEIGALRLDGNAIVGQYEALIRPRVKVEPGAFATHGLSDDYLSAYGREPAAVLTEFFQWVEDSPLVAHNGISFDFPFLAEEAQRYAIPRPPLRLLDTLPLSRAFLATPNGSFSLKSLCAAYGVTNEHAHRALADAKATTEIFKHILKACPDAEKLWRMSYGFELSRLLEPPAGFEWVQAAMDRGEDLKIAYESGGTPPGRERWIHPLNFSVGISGRPSLRAMCLEDKIEKQFRLDRMRKPHSSNESTPK